MKPPNTYPRVTSQDHGAHEDYPSCCGESSSVPAAMADTFRFVFKVQGLDCAEEVSVLRRAIGPLVGGEARLAFDVLNGPMLILTGAEPVSAEVIRKAVRQTGMSAVEWRRGDDGAGTADDLRRRDQVWSTILSALFVLTGLAVHVWLAGGFGEALRLFGGHDGHAMPLSEVVAYALAIAFGMRFSIVKAWHAAHRLRPDMNLLMVIAVAGAIGIGEWFEAATVACLFSLSLTLESWSVGRARRSKKRSAAAADGRTWAGTTGVRAAHATCPAAMPAFTSNSRCGASSARVAAK